ncbi:REP element-mobilizing transposase RayT [Flavobacterium sp. HSC-32F16]|uniref:transposase n=1 Tax=Flavobacterium sp. HSC-32F16 TaxID=2910964 RepID=UPI0020A29C8F|nr:transposase [Flavobacterium sp. HSC-32F16]MCP2025070.1 REP element-mobilizing transposase RayT [Flavobacterium sp. HSC-32F16]
MMLYKDKLKIDSNFLKDWDYSSEGVYFITMVTRDRECIFGSVEDGKMILNENGKIIEKELLKSIKICKNWFFHNWVVMPNHVHLLIEIQENKEIQSDTSCIVETHSISTINQNTQDTALQKMSTHVAERHCCAPLQCQSELKFTNESNFSRKANSISSFVAIFKSITTKQIKGLEQNYHDHIVRNYKRFETIYHYIKNNPQSWDTDSINSKFQ